MNNIRNRTVHNGLSCLSSLCLFDGIPLGHAHLLFIAGEEAVHKGLIHGGRKETYDGHQYDACHHSHYACVDGRLHPCRKDGFYEHIGNHKAGAEDKAEPYSCLGRPLPVQTVQKRRQKGSGQSAPGNTHELSDKGHIGLILEQGDDHGYDDEHGHQHPHAEQLLLFLQILFEMSDEVQGHGGAGGEHQTGQRGHGSRQYQDHRNGNEDIRQRGQHGGHDLVESALVHLRLGEEQPSESAQEIAAACHYKSEHSGHDGAGLDGFFTFDGIKLLHHLRQAPCTERGKEHHADQVERIRSQEGSKGTADIACAVLYLGEFFHGGHETALTAQHGGNDHHDTDEHDHALDKIVDGGSHVAAGDNIDAGQHAHGDNAYGVVNVEGHAEQTGQAVEQRRRIRDQENEDDHRRGNFQIFAVETLAEEIRHGGTVQMLGHDTGTPSQKLPRHEAADEHIAKAHPRGGHAVLPAELSGVTDEDHRRKVGSAVGKSREPRAYRPAAQHEIVDVGGMLSGIQSDGYHAAEENDQQ